MLKRIIRSTFIGTLLISEFHRIEGAIYPKLISDEVAVKRYYKRVSGKELNLDNPELFSEKTNWYKLNDKNILMQQCADKYAVREYVSKCGFKESLNELYGIYTKIEDIDLKELPSEFVLKAAHGSHMSIIWPYTNYKWWQVKLLLRSWIKQDIYWSGREWVYKNIPKRIIAEKYLVDETGELRDYKFFCYSGKPVFLQFDAGRFGDKHYRNYYDMNLNLLDIKDDDTSVNPELIPTDMETYKKMQQMASVLSEPFQFVRVDLYSVYGKIYFGEMTFFDGGGWSGFSKEEYEIMFGKPWDLKY